MAEPQSQTSRTKSLWPFYREVDGLEFSNHQKARDRFDQILAEGLSHYTGPPDLWHNIAMTAGRVQHNQAQLAFVEEGLREWPNNVDLLCDALQYRFSIHFDQEQAQRLWQTLASMPREQTGPYWRFWGYGAIYHATTLNDPVTALQLLDDGLLFVKRDGLMDILRTYRRVLIDSVPLRTLDSIDQLAAYHQEALAILESRYRMGIQLGIENAYVLAQDLARLYQERAGVEADESTPKEPDTYLRKALEYLDLAEKLYTGDPNHQVWTIYVQRVRILMAQHKYGEALKMLRSLPERMREGDPSLATMYKLAAYMTGESIEEAADRSATVAGQAAEKTKAEHLEEALQIIFANEGSLLFEIAKNNPAVVNILRRIVRALDMEKR
ncbi:hypothetical protein A6A03_12950 [Chloroflexus islandicus]|uniref:Tetratricopeptide repeat protein n=1 Tax=Chloroflexus islandicus TaxID=1707952 RepID=A0A178MBV7_9CHLR|nr:hypothetical protein [Chloroflexus islandicus]OAN46281.1 hypothetical protein A6A03_12950 [Chloroflexus islandicus]